MTLTCSNCGKDEFVTVKNIIKEAEEVYTVVEIFRCHSCGEKLPMSRYPSGYIGLLKLGEDV